MKQQHWIAVAPPGETPLGKDLLIITIWKSVLAADALVTPERGRQDRAGDRAEPPDQRRGWEGTARGDHATSIGGVRGEDPPEFGAQSWGEWRHEGLGIVLIQSEPTFCKVSGQDEITRLLAFFFFSGS